MILEVYCPNCGAWKRTHDIADAPQIKRCAALACRKKGRRTGPVSREELGPEADAFLRAWGKRFLSNGSEEVVHCACGGVVRYEVDDQDELGVRLVDATPDGRRRPGPPGKMRGT